LIDEDLRHHEVGDYDGDKHVVVMVDAVHTLEFSIHESNRRGTAW